MLNRGVALTGIGVDFHTVVVRVSQQLFPLVADSLSPAAEQTITMEVSKTGYSPNQFTLHKGIPVKWIINAKELTECNKVIVVPQYGLEIKLQPGVQVITFTPAESGEVVVPWSCWMGMIHGTFIVGENPQRIKQTLPLDQTTPMPPSDQSVKENTQQRLIRELNNKWQEFLTLFDGVAHK